MKNEKKDEFIVLTEEKLEEIVDMVYRQAIEDYQDFLAGLKLSPAGKINEKLKNIFGDKKW